MKNIVQILILITLSSCYSEKHKNIEEIAINDITSDYLRIKHLKKINRKPPPLSKEDEEEQIEIMFERKEQQDVYKVYISDALLPISQIKEDNLWMFDRLYNNETLDSLFKTLHYSENFKALRYREFDKNHINLIPPYKQFHNKKQEISEDEKYLILSFSRVVFSSDYKYGLVVIKYSCGWTNGTSNGFHRPYLIENINNKWKVIDEN